MPKPKSAIASTTIHHVTCAPSGPPLETVNCDQLSEAGGLTLISGGFNELESDRSKADCGRRRGDYDHRTACVAVRKKEQEYDSWLALGAHAKPPRFPPMIALQNLRFEWSDYDFSSGEPAGEREHTD